MSISAPRARTGTADEMLAGCNWRVGVCEDMLRYTALLRVRLL
jgi:hypothetical protein